MFVKLLGFLQMKKIMDNIENSIRHLQGSLKRRAMNISYAAQEVADFKFYMNTLSKTVNKTVRTEKTVRIEINYTTAKCRLAKLVRQQKTEKKMLAMMYSLNRRVYNKHTDRLIREYCVKLDCL